MLGRMVRWDTAPDLNMTTTRQKLLFLCLILLIFIVSPSGLGCTATKKDPLSDLKGGYTAHILIRINGIETSGSVLASPQVENGRRSISLSLESPDALAGLSIVFFESGEVKLSFGESEISVSEQDSARIFSFGDIYKILSAKESITSISSAKGGEIGIPDRDRVTRISLGDVIIYIDPEDSTPIKALCSSSGCEIFFYSFKSTE